MSNLPEPEYKDYVDSLVGFIDILGFDKRARDISNADEFFEVGNLLYAIKTTADGLSSAEGILEEFKITAISDSIIVTVPFTNKVCTTGMVQILHKIQYEMLGTAFKTLVRGYITRGRVYHNNGLIFGPGYSDAYKGEGKIGDAPRVVLDPNIVIDARRVINSTDNLENMVTVFDYLKKDATDGLHFIDYLKPIGSQKFLSKEQLLSERISIREFIDKSLSKYTDENKIKEKYIWLKNYFDSTEVYF